MIKKLFIATSLLAMVFSFAQYRSYRNYRNYGSDKTNELKVNALSLLTYGTEIGYEKSVSDDVGFGATVMIPYQYEGSPDFLKPNLNYYVSPYVRFYFDPMNSGFFFEGFGMYANRKDPNYDSSAIDATPNYSTLGLGIGGGRKWTSPSGFSLEGSAGIGRNVMLPENASLTQNFVVKVGVSAGFKF